jgi:signal transduction histidine kinase
LCRKLVTVMGGELNVETQPHRGTRFYFELDLPTIDSI